MTKIRTMGPKHEAKFTIVGNSEASIFQGLAVSFSEFSFQPLDIPSPLSLQ